MGLRTVYENFRSLRWKLSPWQAFEVDASTLWWLIAFINGIINWWTWGNRIILDSLRVFEVVLKVPVIIIIRFCEKIMYKKEYIHVHRYMLIAGVGGGVYMVYLTLFCLLFIKIKKITRAWPILQSNSTSFRSYFFFSRMNNNKNMKLRALGDLLNFF